MAELMFRRIVVWVVLLLVAGQFVVPLAKALEPILISLSVLALAIAGLWLIASAPFRRRR